MNDEWRATELLASPLWQGEVDPVQIAVTDSTGPPDTCRSRVPV